MEAFVGEIAGILMIVLIIILLFKLLSDVISDKVSLFLKKHKKIIILSLIFGILQMMVGALMYTVLKERASVFQFDIIWKVESISNDMDYLNNFSYQGLLQVGRFPLYYLLVHLLSKVLFNAVFQSALYIGLLSGVITITSIYILLSHHVDDTESNSKLNAIMWCIPGSFFLFIPSSFSLGIALICMFFAVWNQGKGNKWVSLFIAILSLLTHFLGIIPICFLFFNKFLKEKKYQHIANLFIIILIYTFGIVKKIGSIYEFILPLEIIAGFIFCRKKQFFSYHIEVLVEISMILISGFWILMSLNVG